MKLARRPDGSERRNVTNYPNGINKNPPSAVFRERKRTC